MLSANIYFFSSFRRETPFPTRESSPGLASSSNPAFQGVGYHPLGCRVMNGSFYIKCVSNFSWSEDQWTHKFPAKLTPNIQLWNQDGITTLTPPTVTEFVSKLMAYQATRPSLRLCMCFTCLSQLHAHSCFLFILPGCVTFLCYGIPSHHPWWPPFLVR